MLRRSILEISSRHRPHRISSQISNQIPSYLSTRKDFSTASQQNVTPKPGSTDKPPDSGSSLPKVVVGGVAVGAAFLAAYQTGYLDEFIGKERQNNIQTHTFGVDKNDAKDVQGLEEKLASLNGKEKEPHKASPDIGSEGQKVVTHSHIPALKGFIDKQGENQPKVQDNSDLTPEEGTVPVHVKDVLKDSHSSTASDVTSDEGTIPHEKDLLQDSQHSMVSIVTPEGETVNIQEQDLSGKSHSTVASGDQSTEIGISLKGNLDREIPEESTETKQNEELQVPPISTWNSDVPEEYGKQIITPQDLSAEDKSEDALGTDIQLPVPLLDEYYLHDKAEKSAATALYGEGNDVYKDIPKGKEALASELEELNRGSIKFIEAIHTAEKMQAEFDARVFSEEKRAIKEKYEKELKDAIAREFMRAEEAAILDKELNRERAKAAAAIKSLQEKLEQKLKMELEQKENEAEMKLKNAQDLAKAELAAAIASEKLSQIEKIAEANLHINALCMAFYARSEQALQTHSIHKLALGALALEDALSKGLPIRAELEALHSHIEAIDKDSILDLVISSIPEETRNHGTDTPLQLNQKFDALKGTLRHFSLIPPGGGGLFAHSLARVASLLRVRESDQSGDGIESVINKVDTLLANGKLAEAADALEEGVKGCRAAEFVGDWVTRARNRAITEQALTVLQSYATTISQVT